MSFTVTTVGRDVISTLHAEHQEEDNTPSELSDI
jgi:hypothetical protein